MKLILCFVILFLGGVLHASPKFFTPRSLIQETELQWSVCETSTQDISKKLNLSWKAKKPKDLSYYDTAALDLFKTGIILRVRGAKSTAKLRGIQENQIDWDWLSTRDSKCEWDRVGASQKISCSVNEEDLPSNLLFSQDQKDFILSLYPKTQFTSLKQFGPYKFEEFESKSTFVGHLISMESVTSKQTTFFELSTRTSTSQAAQAFQDLTNEFVRLGLNICSDQKGMTEKLLTK